MSELKIKIDFSKIERRKQLELLRAIGFDATEALDEKTEKEKRTHVTYLVQGASTRGAEDNTKKVMDGTAIDYVVDSVSDTKILDVFEHDSKE